MNYYERIQKSLDYIEDNMEGSIELEIVTQKVYMSMKTTLPSLQDTWNEMGRWMALTNSKVQSDNGLRNGCLITGISQ